MELGLPRREALHKLERRTEVPEPSNFVRTLMQADALGMPVGRVAKPSAEEMRPRRQHCAPKEAAKRPLRIQLPRARPTFPAISVVWLAPGAFDIGRALGG